MTKYFIDWTDIGKYVETQSAISGIQRVAFMLAKKLVDRFGPDAVRICRYDSATGTYRSFRSDFLVSHDEFNSTNIRQVLELNPTAFGAPTLEKYAHRPIKKSYYAIVRDVNALFGRERHFAKRRSSIAEWKAYRRNVRRSRREQTAEPEPVDVFHEARRGDRLCLMGATWSVHGTDQNFARLHDMGLFVSIVIYDLIPLVAPQHLGEGLQLEFDRWLSYTTTYVDLYFAISACTKRDLEAYLKENNVDKDIYVVPLARQSLIQEPDKPNADIVSPSAIIRPVEVAQPIANIARMPYVLCVGTIESRKNVWRLAQAWKRLSRRADIEIPRLVFAGKRGWLVEDFFNWMDTTAWLEGWLQFVIMPTDAELDYLYRNCLFTVMVSIYEGWGLPIGEGLAYGKTGVVSDVSSMPEVGGDMVEYCDPYSISSIHDACLRLIVDGEHRCALERRIAKTELRTWDEVASDYMDVLMSVPGK